MFHKMIIRATQMGEVSVSKRETLLIVKVKKIKSKRMARAIKIKATVNLKLFSKMTQMKKMK